MGEEHELDKQHKKKKGMKGKTKKGSVGFDRDYSSKAATGARSNGSFKGRKNVQHDNSLASTSHIRKQVDPETAQYFSEIANIFESTGVDLEERSVICGNALEETRGKEFELATDYIISHTLQALLEGCDVDHLCGFLRSCAKDFPSIAMDRSGSHVAETAIKSLATHLQDQEVHHVIEEALTMICKVIAADPVNMMCDCYGSHVLRSLLCLCKGVELEKFEYYHGVSKSLSKAERLNSKVLKGDHASNFLPGFPNVLKLLVSEMLKCVMKYNKTLQVDQYGSSVLQTVLKLLASDDEELLYAIPILLGCNEKNISEGNFIEATRVRELLNFLKETSFSHLMEVILEAAPDALYDEMFTKIFRNSLFELSSHHCGNFVVQALISHAKNKDQMELLWEELGPNVEQLFKLGRSGVITALIAASERLQIHEEKSCQFLAAAVHSADESPKWIVPRLLFLDSYFTYGDKSNWSWPSVGKMHTMGSLILQIVFRFRSEYIEPYIKSIISMEPSHLLEAAKNRGGSHVIESFLSSGASEKQKLKLAKKLKGHLGELALHPSGYFAVDKLFTLSDLSLKEAITQELMAVRSELSKTKHGPYLLRKLDMDGFVARPDHWRSKQASKESTYKEFHAMFGSGGTKSAKKGGFLADTSKHKSHPSNLKEVRKEIHKSLSSSVPFLSMSGRKRKSEKAKPKSNKDTQMGGDDKNSNREKKRSDKKKHKGGSDNVGTAKKRHRDDNFHEAPQKKLKP
ncbi:hypothetical protein L6164_004137 [Bauhinia variegata]|uniref:Uncharacterized protein n=1 Tax=Bauhinia variegata TaxID=167791 RepID=A0ACB9Q3Q4_BAUVA|nr:hypothetical protein L6164_004137 [Bauhinia variegata]